MTSETDKWINIVYLFMVFKIKLHSFSSNEMLQNFATPKCKYHKYLYSVEFPVMSYSRETQNIKLFSKCESPYSLQNTVMPLTEVTYKI
jgi:hypothetical protein